MSRSDSHPNQWVLARQFMLVVAPRGRMHPVVAAVIQGLGSRRMRGGIDRAT